MDLLDRIAAAKEEADASSNVLDRVKSLVEEGKSLQETIDSLQEALKSTVGRFNRIKQYELPNIMKENNIGEYRTLDGTVYVKFDTYVSGSLPKEEHDREAALEILEKSGGQSLIKTEVSVDFPKSQHNMAKDFFVRVQEMLKTYDPADEIEFNPTFNESVHAATLQKFGREKLKAGEELDWEALGLSVGHHCKFDFFQEDPVTKKMKKLKKKTTEGGTSDE